MKVTQKTEGLKPFSYKVFCVQFRSLGLKAIEKEFFKQIKSKPRDNVCVFSLEEVLKKTFSPKGQYLSLFLYLINCIVFIENELLDSEQFAGKIEWDKLDSDDFERILQTILEVIETNVQNCSIALEAERQQRKFDLLEYWSSFKGSGNPRKSLDGKKRNSNTKAAASCKLNKVDKITLTEKPSSKLKAYSILKPKAMVSFFRF